MPLAHVLAVLTLAASPVDEREARAGSAVFSVGGGYAIPFGDLFNTDAINVNNAMKGGFPVHGEAGIALWRSWHVVAYVDYAFLDRSDRCAPGDPCSGTSLRLGGQVQYWGSGRFGWIPFIGLGGGWEKLRLDEQNGSLLFSGFEGSLIGGAVYFFTSWLGIGPYFEARVGAYSTINLVGWSGPPPDPAAHGWLVLGVRLDLWP
jgi:hypothetical protein